MTWNSLLKNASKTIYIFIMKPFRTPMEIPFYRLLQYIGSWFHRSSSFIHEKECVINPLYISEIYAYFYLQKIFFHAKSDFTEMVIAYTYVDLVVQRSDVCMWPNHLNWWLIQLKKRTLFFSNDNLAFCMTNNFLE